MRPPQPDPERDEDFIRFRVKQELRRRMKAVRGALPRDARRKRAEALAAQADGLLDALPFDPEAPVVAAYVPIRGEVDPGPLLARLLARGHTRALPRVAGDDAILHLAPDDAALIVGGRYQIPEPPSDAERVDLERVGLVLVPGLALDERGHRVGWGRGYYDRLLPTLPRARRVGLVYDFQLIGEVPNRPGDEPLDVVLTDARYLEARR